LGRKDLKRKLFCLALMLGEVFLVFSMKSSVLDLTSARLVAISLMVAREDGSPVVLVGAGDIADCKDLKGAQATAALLATISGTILAAGETGCPDGTEENFEPCYAPTWGRLRDRSRPAPGNHEYHSRGGAAYFKYFGTVAASAHRKRNGCGRIWPHTASHAHWRTDITPCPTRVGHMGMIQR
jgi:hypothetical protein